MNFKIAMLLITFLIFLCSIGSICATDDIIIDNLTSTDEAMVHSEDADSLQIDSVQDTKLNENNDEKEVLAAGVSDLIYVNVSSSNNPWDYSVTGADWNKAYGTDQGLHVAVMYINKNGKIIVADGNYTTAPHYENVLLNRYMYPFTIEGYGKNVTFSFNNDYNLDVGSATGYEAMHEGLYAVNLNITHKNIIFDCDVKVGSRNFEFVNCTFNKKFEITRDYQSGDICNVTFIDCIFVNQLLIENIADNTTVIVNGNQFFPKIVDENSTVDNITNGTSTNSSGNVTSGNGTSTGTGKTNTNTNKQTTTKVTKKATKITASKKTFKVKTKTKKYTITLKAGKNAVKKVKVTIKIGKKTYKSTTNSKGKATFKITKLTKKGKYNAVIKFAGNKNFEATSKKVKITVKK